MNSAHFERPANQRVLRPMQELGPNQKAWIAALRSGEYKQGKDYLTQNDLHCCLGAGCVVFAIESIQKPDGIVEYDGHTTSAPDLLRKKLALRDDMGKLAPGIYISGHYRDLAAANDAGLPFSEIADFCEQHSEAVFTEPR